MAGSLMGLFTRHRSEPAAATEAAPTGRGSGDTWWPVFDDYTIVIGSDADMGDDGQVMARAYRVDYQSSKACMTVYAYVTWGPSGNGTCYMVGYRCDQWAPGAAEPWTVWDHVHGSQVYTDLAGADEGARQCAEYLTAVPRDRGWETALPFLGWDGQPW